MYPTVKAKVALSDAGTPPFNERVLAAMVAGNQEPSPRRYLSIDQVAELRDVSRDVVRADIVAGSLRASRMGAGHRSHYRVSLPALKAYLVLLGESDEYILLCMADAEALGSKRMG
jgi:excisionase family DNA binding protein